MDSSQWRGSRHGCAGFFNSKSTRVRFGPIPKAVVQRVNAADMEQMAPWIVSVISAVTLEEVFNGEK